MWRITTFTGTVLEVHRFINTRSRGFERPICRERRELWLSTGQDDEYQFFIHTKLMPARKTHCVILVLAGMTVLGLYNATTGTSANYIREDPPYLTRGRDALPIALLALCGLIGMALGHPSGWLILMSVPTYLASAIICRAAARRRLRNTVDDVLNELQMRQVVRPIHLVGRR